MAEHAARPPGGARLPQPDEASSSATPAPPDDLHVTLTTLIAGEVLHRVHLEKYGADQFNPGVHGNARFSPIQDERGQPIPTLYAGTTMPCALMETVFHDVPHVPGFKSFDRGKLTGQQHSVVEVTQELRLADLRSLALRKLGISRRQLIDTEKEQYPATRKWAQALHRQCLEAQGLLWVSRQDDSARAFVFFGDRVPDGALRQRGDSRSLLEDADAYDEVLDLAERIGVSIVSGKL
jgi:hypothetical protein